MNLPKVSIIILNYNGGDFVLNCLKSIYQTNDISFEIILIDNDSNDNSQNHCKEKFSDIILIENKENIGMGARTIGINKANGEYIAFLDYDTIVEPNWLKKFLKSFQEHGSGLYQPKLLELENKNIINSAGNMINPFGLGFSRGKGQKDEGQYNKFQQISYTSGACTFSSSKIMKQLKKVDPIFFLYHDDLDFGWRANLMGISSFYEPQISVYHYGSPNLQWSGKKFYYLERNRWICLKSLYSEKTYREIFPYLAIFEIGIFFYLLVKGLGIQKIKSTYSILKLKNEIQKKREDTIKNRKILDSKIIENFTSEFYFPEILVKGKKRSIISKIIENLSRKMIKRISHQADNSKS
jgi:GT2 family glycosyltransferase